MEGGAAAGLNHDAVGRPHAGLRGIADRVAIRCRPPGGNVVPAVHTGVARQLDAPLRREGGADTHVEQADAHELANALPRAAAEQGA